MSQNDYPIGEHDAERIAVLHEMKILDSIEEGSFDEFTAMCAEIFDVKTVVVSLVDTDRQWFKSHHGLDAHQTERKVAFCNYTVLGDEIFEVTDPLHDPRFKDNPLVTGDLGLRYYCGAPIIIKEMSIGALCLIDYNERQPLDEKQRRILTRLAAVCSRDIQNRYLLKKTTGMMSSMLKSMD